MTVSTTTAVRNKAEHLKPHQWKKGQSGNPKGRNVHSRNKLTELFIQHLCKSWETYGEAALMTAALTAPVEFCRLVAGLMPKDVEVTISHVQADRVSDNELADIATRGRPLTLEAQKDSQEVFTVGESERV
jgi:hypothetical protein